MVSGWEAASNGPGSSHVVWLVEAAKLAKSCGELDPVTGLHVYSVLPGQPTSGDDLWNQDHLQALVRHVGAVNGDALAHL
jgi:hypothetical protein